MASYVNDLRLKEIGTGESSGTWGSETNTNLELIGDALGFGTEAITTNADTHTTTVADGSADAGRAMYIKYTGTLDSACTITIGPNTINRMHFIENATTGSQNIIISQGTGSNVTIPAGDVKAVYLDGAGSGAAVADAFTDLNLAGTTTVDALNVSGALTGSSTIQGTTITATTAFVPDASDGAALGTSSLEFSDLFLADAAVINLGDDQDTTLTHVADTGILLNSTRQLQFGDSGTYIHQSADGVLDLVSDTELELNATTIDINGNADISGTLGVTGAVTADAGVSIDNITIDGTEIDLSSGDLTIDVAGDIVLDADGAQVFFKDGGTTRYTFNLDSTPDLVMAGGNASITTSTSDADFTIIGNDGGSDINALTFDMSAAGAATFNSSATFGGNIIGEDIKASGSGGLTLQTDEGTKRLVITDAGRVGIGTTSPSSILHCVVSGADAKIQVETDGGNDAILELTAPAGSGAQSKLMFSDDGASGVGSIVYAHNSGGTDYMTFATASTERMRIDSSGKVGIGNTAPLGKLTISNAAGSNAPTSITAANTYLQLGSDDFGASSNGKFMIGFGYTDASNTNSPAYMGFQETSNSGDTKGVLTFHTRDVITDTAPLEQMRIASNGSIGMGTTPPTDSHSGWTQLFIGTRASVVSENDRAVSGLDGTWLTDNMYVDSDTGAFANITTDESSAINQNGGDIKFFSQASGSAGAGITLSQKMLIASDGKVGIGESAPANAKLEVLQAGDHDAHSTHGIAIHSTGNTNFTSMYMGCEDGIDSAYIQSVALDGSFTSKSLLLNPNGGQVKIGTNATNTTAGLRVDLDTSTTNIGALIVNNPNSSASRVATFNTGNNSATIIAFDKDFAAIGSISNSSGTVSYNAFMGSHYTESPDNLSSVLKGTVMETIDDLVTEKYAEQKRLTKCKVSDTSESNCVYGVWLGDTENNLVAAIGASWCRVNSSITVTKGDLLVSNGDGTAKVQSDDIIRSKTIGKVTSNVKTTTYSDGSYLVPVVLYCG